MDIRHTDNKITLSNNKKILVVVPAQNTYGGVYNFYKNIEEHLTSSTEYFYLGNEKAKIKNKLILFFIRLFRFRRTIRTKKFDLVILNPSLNLFAVLRDAIYLSLCKYYKMYIKYKMGKYNHTCI